MRTIVVLLLLIVPTTGRAADRSERVILKEDFQVLQRDAADEATTLSYKL
jgi:hypothetical protein